MHIKTTLKHQNIKKSNFYKNVQKLLMGGLKQHCVLLLLTSRILLHVLHPVYPDQATPITNHAIVPWLLFLHLKPADKAVDAEGRVQGPLGPGPVPARDPVVGVHHHNPPPVL